MSSSQPIIFVCQGELTEFFAELTEFAGENSVSSLLRNSTLETVFRPFPNLGSSRPHKCTEKGRVGLAILNSHRVEACCDWSLRPSAIPLGNRLRFQVWLGAARDDTTQIASDLRPKGEGH